MLRKRLPVVALLSMTLLALELVWTRIFSAEFFYTYAFLTLSLAIMGLGLGGLALRSFRFLNREATLGASLLLAGLFSLTGPPLVFQFGLDFSQIHSSWSMLGVFVATVLLMSVPFFLGGIALALLFRTNPEEMPRLYMADLLGAGAGVVGAILVMNSVEPPSGSHRPYSSPP